MKEQLETVFKREGVEAMFLYARQTLSVYRKCARPQANGTNHFAHLMPFRPHFVRSIRQLRTILRDEKEYRKLLGDKE